MAEVTVENDELEIKTAAVKAVGQLKDDIPHRVRLNLDVPGNTIGSLQKTIQTIVKQVPQGTTILLEFDVRMAKGVPVVLHDPTYLNMAGETVTVADMTVDQLREPQNFIKDSNEPVPLLEEFIPAAHKIAGDHLELFFNIDTKDDASVGIGSFDSVETSYEMVDNAPYIRFLEENLKQTLQDALEKSNLSGNAKSAVQTYIDDGLKEYLAQEKITGLNLQAVLKNFLLPSGLGIIDRTNFASFNDERTQKVKNHFARWGIATSSSPGRNEVIKFLGRAVYLTEGGRKNYAEKHDFTCIQIPGTIRHAIPGEIKEKVPDFIKNLIPEKIKNTIVAPSWLTERLQQMGFTSVHIWTINSEADRMSYFMKQDGVLVITDYPELAMQIRNDLQPTYITSQQKKNLALPSNRKDAQILHENTSDATAANIDTAKKVFGPQGPVRGLATNFGEEISVAQANVKPAVFSKATAAFKVIKSTAQSTKGWVSPNAKSAVEGKNNQTSRTPKP